MTLAMVALPPMPLPSMFAHAQPALPCHTHPVLPEPQTLEPTCPTLCLVASSLGCSLYIASFITLGANPQGHRRLKLCVPPSG